MFIISSLDTRPARLFGGLIVLTAMLSALCGGTGPAPASASAATDGAAICDGAALQGSAAHGVPIDVLRALTRTETGRAEGGRLNPWPWTVNMEGAGFWFGSRAEALAFVRQRHAAGARSFDIGCFQINFRWHGGAFASIDAMFDPGANARYAARFLSELKAEGRDWIGAAGAFHSRTPSFADKYKDRFARILARLHPADPDGVMMHAAQSAASATSGAGEGARMPGGVFAYGPGHAKPELRRQATRGAVALTTFAPAGAGILTAAIPLLGGE